MGNLKDDNSLALVYSASEVMLVPSTEEGFGQTALEAMSCGTPVVAFDGTGVCDLITHKENGYISEWSDSRDYAAGILWCIGLGDGVRVKCRETVEAEYTLILQAQRYLRLYQSIQD
jgi:glycosyltransferase involved in cell wall biosynthesis